MNPKRMLRVNKDRDIIGRGVAGEDEAIAKGGRGSWNRSICSG